MDAFVILGDSNMSKTQTMVIPNALFSNTDGDHVYEMEEVCYILFDFALISFFVV